MNQQVRILDIKRVYQGFYRVLRLMVRYPRFDGSLCPAHPLECVERGEAVAILLYDPQQDAVVLIRQFRIGAYLKQGQGWGLEIVAGGCEGTDDLATQARREILEETGFVPYRLDYLFAYFSVPGLSSERVHLYLGLVDTTQTTTGRGGGLDHENEDIETLIMPFPEALARIELGEVHSSTGIMALQWLALHKDALSLP
ncbi:MAG: NUDIX domain-containing protein [Magnetococcales bacterium]|nr:NUDIX domain-containing protein [Magnetococcales bacterium]